MATWYLASNKYSAIAQWAANTAYVVGDIVRQLAAPGLNNERAFRVTTAGTSHLTTEPTWTLTKAGTTNDNTVVWTEVTGNSAYGWNAASPRQRLFMSGGSSWAAAGDTVKRHASHAETQTTQVTYSSPGTAASPLFVYTVNDADTALSTGASVSIAGGSDSYDFDGFTYDYGMTYIGTAAGGTVVRYGSAGTNWWKLVSGGFTFSGNSSITIGANASSLDDRLVEWENVVLSFNSTAGGVTLDGYLTWKGGSVTGATLPNTLISNVTTGPGAFLYAYGLDLSALGSGKTIVAQQHGQMGDILFENCKLGASVALTSGTIPGQGGLRVRFVNCDSAATNYRYQGSEYSGTITHETTIVLLAATSRKMVSTSGSKFSHPLILDDIVVFNNVTGSAITVTAEIVNDGLTLTDAEVWLEVEYLGTSGFPISTFINDGLADRLYGTPANQTSSSSGWVTTGLGSPVKQKLEVTFTPQLAGVLKCRVMLARASTTIYVDPQIVVS